MANKAANIPVTAPPHPSAERLDSWKEIAAYLKCSERTVRRWEQEGLPVHRHPHKKKAGIYAYKAELDAWWTAGHARLEAAEGAQGGQRQGRPWKATVVMGAGAIAVVFLASLGAIQLGERFIPSPRPTAASAVPVIRSLAILPLENLSRDPRQDYFADGMTDELITDLAQIGALRVISRASIMQYKSRQASAPQIARELNVDALIEGTVLQAGGRVRITAQLIDARSDRHLWAKSYEGNLQDVLALQDSVAEAIANEVKVELTPQQQRRLSSPRVVNPAAHEAYLRGLYELHGLAAGSSSEQKQRFVNQAIGHFQQAVTLDPADAPAYAGLADAYYDLSTGYKAPLEVMPQAKAAALKAIALDNSLAEAHASLGQVAFFYDWDWSRAEREFRQALALNPNLPQAHAGLAEYLVLAGGEPDEAITELKEAYALDPLLPLTHGSLASFLFMARRYPEAAAAARQMGDDSSLGLAEARLGRPDQTIAAAGRLARAARGPVAWAEAATLYALAGKPNESRALLRRVEAEAKNRYVCGYNVACVYAALGEKNQAIAWLNRALLSRSD